jgi:signal transduction histidine kinase
VKLAKATVNSKPPVARKPPKREASSRVQLEKRLAEALEQQAATSEILRVISSSQTDVQPVFDTIAANALRLCDAKFSAIFRFDSELIHLAALHNVSPEGADAYRGAYPMPPGRGSGAARAILTRNIVHISDVREDPEYVLQGLAQTADFRSNLSVPMLRDGHPIGAITVTGEAARPFPDKQVELLKTFADQAVIAIENVRLFTELGTRNRDLTVALDQQTATSEILRVISSSQTDVQPVFDAIVRSAVGLCGADHSVAARFDGELLHALAFYGFSPEALKIIERTFPMRPSMENMLGRATLKRAVDNLPDMLADPEYSREYAMAGGWRSGLAVPMLRDGNLIGAIAVSRTEPGAFPAQHVELLKTFADQAVIAIENVRLFKELEARNHDLTESLDQQTATSEILRVISQSPTDVQPVFDAIARNARRLCGTDSASVLMFDGTLIHLSAVDNENAEQVEALRRAYPSSASHRSAGGRAILTGRAVHIPDVLEDPSYEFAGLQGAGLRSMLSVPMLRHGAAIGAIVVHTWAVSRPFGNKQTELLQIFADQAVIAVENARLFKELQARTNELTRSVSQLTALGEISQAVSSTLDVETVLDTIVSRASQLASADGCSIYEFDEATQAFHVRATHNYGSALVETLRATPLRRGEGAMGRATETGEPIQIADIAVPGAYQSHLRDVLIGAGFRALLSVPLLREEQIIGSLSLNRNVPGDFPPEVIEILKTFATQSALAIQNARLFREIADKSRQLEVASRHKSEFLANMSHELRTPLNAIIGFSEVLSERMFGELNEKQDEYMKDIHASGTHLLSLINDILDLSKVEAGRMELELSDFDLPAAIDSAVTLVRERATRRGITLRTVVDERIDEVRGDERKIRQVTLNLLSNAIKFTPEGGWIEVGAARVDGLIEVSVTDSGVGIAPEDQEAVFEEFRQVGASAAKQEGTGLGLTLCRKFVELHGGNIRVTSEVGVGSTFTFSIPVRRGE